jgi:hypothetical protein
VVFLLLPAQHRLQVVKFCEAAATTGVIPAAADDDSA